MAKKKKAPAKKTSTKAVNNGRTTNRTNVRNVEAAHIVEEMVQNTLVARQDLIKKFLDPRRDIDDECGYPKTNEITAGHYRLLYDRESIATRFTQVLPKESWKIQPKLVEDEDPKVETDFEKAWEAVGRMLGGQGWFRSKEANPIWEYLLRVDILSGIGHYGVLLLGLDDDGSLEEPVEGVNENGIGIVKADRRLLFVRAFDETQADITAFETDENNPRFGLPTKYNLTLNDPSINHNTATTHHRETAEVHWTRVIHIADNLGSSEIFGVPRMRPVYNRLYDLRKIYGGSAEMYWRGAFPGLALETHPQLGGEVEIDNTAIRSQMENYMNGLQRYLAVMGMGVKSLAPQVVDPTDHIDSQLTAIAILGGIPKRILMGSERGELASSQDESTWNDRLMDRQNMYLSPRVIAPFVDRLIQVGVLPEPTSGYDIKWPDLASMTAQETATVAQIQTDALAKYVGGNVEMLVPAFEYLTKFIGLSEAEAGAVLAAADEQLRMEALEAKDVETDDEVMEEDETDDNEE